MEREIIRLIQERGPLTGGELWDAVGGDGLVLWRTCKLSHELILRHTGTRYLRLDRRIEGFARLSPSILREFLTYTIVGLPQDPESLAERAFAQRSHIESVSRAKLELAYQIVCGLASRFENEWAPNDQACVFIAGDIVFNMAHDVPRPERSTGKLVNGSDMDLVVIAEDQVSDETVKRLDDAIYQEKYRLLITPHLREEIDYIVKKLSRVREQVRFDTFRHMVACKILREGTLLFGNKKLFQAVKGILFEEGVIQKLDDLEKKARVFRTDAEEYLLREDPETADRESLNLFYPCEESEEFE